MHNWFSKWVEEITAVLWLVMGISDAYKGNWWFVILDSALLIMSIGVILDKRKEGK